ncbi:MAG: PilZ domain-containing protein, partial [Candidatus Omnitrophica bacterium]|nr:PilZ domain-containing protein [Candidatus Omnitrophota bacterium]
MYFIYTVTLIILASILILLYNEEKRFKRSITHGLANKYWILRERRKYVRFNDEIRIRYNVRRNSHDYLTSKTANISRKGLCLLTYEKLKEKGYLTLEIELPKTSKIIRLIGQVMWTKDLQTQDAEGRRLFYAGIRFSKIDPDAEAKLLVYLNALKA